MFNYLVSVVEGASYYTSDYTLYEKVCNTLLGVFFFGRYVDHIKLQKAIQRNSLLEHENLMFRRKIDGMCRAYALQHIELGETL